MSYSIRSAIAVGIVEMVIASAAMALRFYTRIFLMKGLWIDDWLAALGFVSLVVMSVFYLLGFSRDGWGRHLKDIHDPQIIEAGFRDLFINELSYYIGTGMLKISFAFTLFRVSTNPIQRGLLHGLVAVIITYSTFILLYSVIFLCSPVHYFWTRVADPYMTAGDPAAHDIQPLGNCRAFQPTSMYVHVVVLVVADLLLGVILPAVLLKDLILHRNLKIISGFMLGLASLATATTVVRVAYVRGLNSKDQLYDARMFLIWSHVEVSWCSVGISLASLTPLLAKLGFFRPVNRSSHIGTYDVTYNDPSSNSGLWSRWRSKLAPLKDRSKNSSQDAEIGAVDDGSKVWTGSSPHDMKFVNVITAEKNSDRSDRNESQEQVFLSSPVPLRATVERTIEVRHERRE